jgi:hypothetical protein
VALVNIWTRVANREGCTNVLGNRWPVPSVMWLNWSLSEHNNVLQRKQEILRRKARLGNSVNASDLVYILWRWGPIIHRSSSRDLTFTTSPVRDTWGKVIWLKRRLNCSWILNRILCTKRVTLTCKIGFALFRDCSPSHGRRSRFCKWQYMTR